MSQCSTVLDAIAAFWDYLASVRPLPLAIAIGCHIAKTMCTSRAWRNVLAAAYPEERVRWPRDLRRLHRGRRRQRDLPRPRRRRRPPDDGAPRRQGSHLHDARQLEPRARDRRLGLRRRALRLGADAGRVPELRRAPVAAELRLRLVPRPPAGLADPARDRRLRRSSRSRSGSGCNVEEFREPRRPGVHRRPHARPAGCARWSSGSSPTGRSASPRSGSCSPPSGSTSRSATCCSSRPRRASPRSCRSAPAASGRSRRSSSTRSAARRHARRCSPSASA